MALDKGVSVHILDKEYLVACGEEERQELLASASYLDQKMREIRDSGKVIGADRIAVMAALNIAHELLTQGDPGSEQNREMSLRLQRLHDKIEGVLFEARQIEM
jgi:cell division protein ZapA